MRQPLFKPAPGTRVTGIVFGLCLGLAGPLVAESSTYTHVLASDRVNGEHTELDADLSPVEMGPMTIRLRTSNHRLRVVEHELALGAAGEGLDAARLRARYQGEADLVAELEVGGVGSEIEDHLVLPLQETEIAGVVQLRLDDGVVWVTTVENPEYVELKVESKLAEKLEILCGGLALVAMGSLDCGALDRLLSVVKVPLPEPGREFSVALEDLTREERRQIEAYLEGRR